MNTDIEVSGGSLDLQPWFQRVESTLTRFDPESPLCQLNRAEGQWVIVPPLLFEAVRAAVAAARETGGAFDPTVLDALEAAGYSRSFELGPGEIGPPLPAGRWRDIEFDLGLGAIRLPPGVRLDLGGIGKGLAVDGAMARCPAKSLCVNAGGDLGVRTVPGDAPVLVDVADPFDPERNLISFGLRHGSVATSSTMGRRWGSGWHHIVDPRTGRPTQSGVLAATVIAGTAAGAEVLAKACIVLGLREGIDLLEAKERHGLLVTREGDLLMTSGTEGFLHAEA